jgi:hypothetical protein
MKGLLKQGNHLVTRVKSNAVAYLYGLFHLSEESRKAGGGANLAETNAFVAVAP